MRSYVKYLTFKLKIHKNISSNCLKYNSQIHNRYFSMNPKDSEVVSKNNLGKPLKGVRILDLTRILAGPFCTMLLGDLGAEVIKVEKPGSGDETRLWGPPFIKKESCYFLSVNRNKKSIAINMKDSSGRKLLTELVKSSDVLIENFIPGKLENSGLHFEEVKKVAPHLIYCSITGFGSDGPYKTSAGYDVIAASIGGLLNITGPENGEPCKVGVAMTDLTTGLFAQAAILTALIEREKTGRGQKIDCDLLSTQVACLVNLSSNYLNFELEPKRRGTAHESIVPYQSFQTEDGYLTVGGGSNSQFEILCKILKLESLLSDERYSSNKSRVKHRDSLLQTLSLQFKTKKTKDWLKKFEGSGIPYGPVNNMQEVFNDPQVVHSGIVKEINHATAGKIKVTGSPVKFSDINNDIELAPPTLGQHTTEILKNVLHLSVNDIELLKKQGTIECSEVNV